jgi:hypothetical protein
MSANPDAPASLALVRGEEVRPTLARIKAEKQLVRHAMEEVMKKDTHFGTIPGTQKPTLYDAGATTILSLFHIALDPETEDLSSADEIRYRVRQVARHAPTGTMLGSAYGEASSNEEKYKWRRAVCKEEFEGTPEDRRRVKWAKGRDGVYSINQVRTEPADIANTVLKMAAKRARVAATLQVTGASDVFAQDLEDLPPEIVEGLSEGEAPKNVPAPRAAAKPTANAPAPQAPVPAAAAPPAAPAAPPREPGDDADELPFNDDQDAPRTPVLTVKTSTFIRSGEKKDGTKWSKWEVSFTDHPPFNTFSKSVHEAALALAGKPARVTVETQGNYENLTAIEAA